MRILTDRIVLEDNKKFLPFLISIEHLQNLAHSGYKKLSQKCKLLQFICIFLLLFVWSTSRLNSLLLLTPHDNPCICSRKYRLAWRFSSSILLDLDRRLRWIDTSLSEVRHEGAETPGLARRDNNVTGDQQTAVREWVKELETREGRWWGGHPTWLTSVV